MKAWYLYKYMAGMVVDTTEGEDDPEYEPHQHRKIENPTSYADTMIHMLKGSIGAGILAMPYATKGVGLIIALGGLIIICAVATYCIHLLIAAQYQLCKRYKRGYMGYPKSMRLALEGGPSYLRCFARFFGVFVDVVLVIWQLGICVIYAVFIAENIKQVCDYYGEVIALRLHLCYVLIPLIIVSMVKDLKLMAPLSGISNVVTLFGLILVFFYLMEDVVEFDAKMLQLRFEGIPEFVGTTLFALEAVGVVLALEYNMEKPKQFGGLFGLFNIGMFIIGFMYTIVGVFGYIKYGDQIMASITLNLPFDQLKAQTAKVFFAFAIFLSFPLQNFVAYNIIWRNLRKTLSESRVRISDYTLRVVLVIFHFCLMRRLVCGAGALAVLVPQLGPFISLFGAFCLTLLGMIFPAMIDLCLWYPNQYGACGYKLLRDLIIIITGIAALVSGCYTSLLSMY